MDSEDASVAERANIPTTRRERVVTRRVRGRFVTSKDTVSYLTVSSEADHFS